MLLSETPNIATSEKETELPNATAAALTGAEARTSKSPTRTAPATAAVKNRSPMDVMNMLYTALTAEAMLWRRGKDQTFSLIALAPNGKGKLFINVFRTVVPRPKQVMVPLVAAAQHQTIGGGEGSHSVELEPPESDSPANDFLQTVEPQESSSPANDFLHTMGPESSEGRRSNSSTPPLLTGTHRVSEGAATAARAGTSPPTMTTMTVTISPPRTARR
jgi:hypothetical protein